MITTMPAVLQKKWTVAPTQLPMRLSVLQETLDRALKMLSGGTSKRLPQLEGVLIQADPYTFSLSVNNLELTQTVTLPAKVERPGAIVTDYATLKELTALLSPERIDMVIEPQDNRLVMTCSTNCTSLTRNYPASDFPPVQTDTSACITVPLAALKEAVTSLARMADKQTEWVEVSLGMSGATIVLDHANAVMIAGDGALDERLYLHVPFTALKNAIANAGKASKDGEAYLSSDGESFSITVGFILEGYAAHHMTYTARMEARKTSARILYEAAPVTSVTFGSHKNAKHKTIGAGKAFAAAKDAFVIDFETGTARVITGESETIYTGTVDTALPFKRIVFAGERLKLMSKVFKASKGDMTLTLLDNHMLRIAGDGFAPTSVEACAIPEPAHLSHEWNLDNLITGTTTFALDTLTCGHYGVDFTGALPVVFEQFAGQPREYLGTLDSTPLAKLFTLWWRQNTAIMLPRPTYMPQWKECMPSANTTCAVVTRRLIETIKAL